MVGASGLIGMDGSTATTGVGVGFGGLGGESSGGGKRIAAGCYYSRCKTKLPSQFLLLDPRRILV